MPEGGVGAARGSGAANVAEVGGVPPRARSRTSLVRRILTYVPGSVIPAGLALVTSMIFTRIFEPVQFGVYSLFLVVATSSKLLLTTWLTQSIGKFLPQEQTAAGRRTAKDALFLSSALVLAVESVLGVAALVVIGPLLAPGWHGFLGPVVLFVLASSSFEVLSTVFSMESRAKEFVTYRLVDSIATLALRLLLVSAVFRMDTRLMFWSVVISNGVLLPLMWARAGMPAPIRLVAVLRSHSARRLTRGFLGFGLPMTLWFLSSILLDVGDRYVLNYLRGAADVGIYDANYRLIAGVAALMVVPVTITLHPYLMGISGTGDADRIGRVIGTIVEKLFLLGALFVGVVYLLHADLALVLLGAQFREGSVVMPVVLAGVFLFNIGTFAHKPFEILGRTRVMVAFGMIAAITNFLVCFLLIPHIGYLGAAYATLVAYLLYAVGVGYLGRRIYPWRIDVSRVLAHGGAIVGGVLAIQLLRTTMAGLPYLWGLGATVVAGAVLTGASLLALLRNGTSSPAPEPAGETSERGRPDGTERR